MFRIGMRRGAIIALAISLGCTFAHAAETPFAGDWGYRDKCQFSHSATLSVKPAGDGVTGQWSDGTDVDGDSGMFKGSVRNGKLYVHFCSEQGAHGGLKKCPAYYEAEDGYFVPEGKDLAWYNRSGTLAENSFVKYLVLHRASNGKPVAIESKCPQGSA